MSFESVLPFVPSYAVVMEIDWQGKILDSWHSNQPDLRFYSEAKIIVSQITPLFFSFINII